MEIKDIQRYAEENNLNIALIDGFDGSTILGLSHDDKVIYSFDKMIQYLKKRDGMSAIEAQDYIEYNTIRALPYLGENAPIILRTEHLIYDDIPPEPEPLPTKTFNEGIFGKHKWRYSK